MKAVWYEEQGSAREVLQYGDLETPSPNPGEVRVRICASGVNPSDTKSRSGWEGMKMQFDRVIPHNDGAGVIDAVGEGVDSKRVGERVWLYETQLGRPFGTAAEFAVLPSEQAVTLPDNTDFAEGACLGVPAMTAHYCIFADGAVEGKTVLVAGGTGAVGNYALQFAKWGGAKVITTVGSDEKKAIALDSGADEVINYKSEDVAQRVKEFTLGEGVDRIVEVAFATNLAVNQKIIKSNGVIATYSSEEKNEPQVPFLPFLLKNTAVRFVLVYVMPKEAHHKAAKDITTCLENKVLKHQIAQKFSLKEVAAAHETVENGQAIGNVAIEIN